jgi:hypothetical protein
VLEAFNATVLKARARIGTMVEGSGVELSDFAAAANLVTGAQEGHATPPTQNHSGPGWAKFYIKGIRACCKVAAFH